MLSRINKEKISKTNQDKMTKRRFIIHLAIPFLGLNHKNSTLGPVSYILYFFCLTSVILSIKPKIAARKTQMELQQEQTLKGKRTRRVSEMEVCRSAEKGRWREETANTELAVDGCCDSGGTEQDRSCFELLVWTDGCLCANYRLSA